MDEQNLPPVDEVPAVGLTRDLVGLPEGSCVLQLVLHQVEDGQHLETRMVMIGAVELDMLNPAHRVAVALQAHLPAILEEALQVEPVALPAGEIAARISDATAQTHLDTHSDAELLGANVEDFGTADDHREFLSGHSDAEGLGTMAPLFTAESIETAPDFSDAPSPTEQAALDTQLHQRNADLEAKGRESFKARTQGKASEVEDGVNLFAPDNKNQ